MAKKKITRVSAVPPAPTSPPSPAFSWAVPDSLHVPPDPLRARLDFHNQACVLSLFEENINEVRIVSALDVAHSLAKELSFSSGLLPPDTLWWSNTGAGPLIAIYEEPRIRRVALQDNANKPPHRYNIPFPGLIFLVQPGKPPWVYAVKSRPTKEANKIYAAPLCNVYEDGRTCPGNHKYPVNIIESVESFFTSFFSPATNLEKRSKKYPDSVVKLWRYLDGKKKFPLDDLVEVGTVNDLLSMHFRRQR